MSGREFDYNINEYFILIWNILPGYFFRAVCSKNFYPTHVCRSITLGDIPQEDNKEFLGNLDKVTSPPRPGHLSQKTTLILNKKTNNKRVIGAWCGIFVMIKSMNCSKQWITKMKKFHYSLECFILFWTYQKKSIFGHLMSIYIYIYILTYVHFK